MHRDESTTRHCASCGLDLTPRRQATGFCCSACEGGGPCTCSYDDMGALAVPMSETAYAALQQDMADAGARLEQLAPDASARALAGLAHGEYFLAARRQHALQGILERAVITSNRDRAALGSTVRYREGDATAVLISLVGPADADPAAGRISVTSPVGAAMLGRRPGEVARVRTPGGVRVLTILAIG